MHIELTRAEPGCISFDVVGSTQSGVWQVDEQFVDAAAFAAHQKRVEASDWGRATFSVSRDYEIRTVE